LSEHSGRLDERFVEPEAATAEEERGEDQMVSASLLEQAQRERDEFLDMGRRVQAEFDNYRKRVAREQQESAARAAERLVKQLVPLLDDLERARDAALEHGELKVGDGVRLVHRSLADLLSREGLVEVPTEGLFDPHTQEALLSQPSEEPEGTVLQVMQKGYALGKHVLRPARVIVSAGLSDGTPGPETD
jgi:molecular chaperone GrpE